MEFFEIDFIEAGEAKSGDAISLRYGDGMNPEMVHVVDGGYAEDGQKIIDHITSHYDQTNFIDHVVLTHPDGDHASGLKSVVAQCNIGTLWMNRPWVHVDSLLPMFDYAYTREGLIRRLKQDYPHTADLERIAMARGIAIRDAFQGTEIGTFIILAPTRNRYLDLVVSSEKTPDPDRTPTLAQQVATKVAVAMRYVASLWGEENLKGDIEGTSRENEMSVVQYGYIAGEQIVLTGDAGVEALDEAYQYATAIGIPLPGVNRFQVPHHGSRRNLSSEVLDKWLGPRLRERPAEPLFHVLISANKLDPDHPRKAVVRALMHRGAGVTTTEDAIVFCWSKNRPARPGWRTADCVEYPSDTEEW